MAIAVATCQMACPRYRMKITLAKSLNEVELYLVSAILGSRGFYFDPFPVQFSQGLRVIWIAYFPTEALCN